MQPDSALIELSRAAREGISALRSEVSGAREDVAGLRAEVTGLTRELAQHRADDRRELDDHETQLRTLSRWRWTLTGGICLLGAMVAPIVTSMLGWWSP